jgi:prophage regulatory protein
VRKILRMKQVEDATGEKRSTIYWRIQEGSFPKPVKLGAKSVGWPEDEVAAYNASRIAARDREVNA